MAQAGSYTAKTTPVSGDKLLLIDSAASDAVKTATLAQVLNNTIIDASWTPALSFGGATTGITYAAQNGRYLKIGNCVIVIAYIVLTSKGSATGNAAITLPATASGSYVAPFATGWSLPGTYVNVQVQPSFGLASATISGATAAATSLTQLTHAAFDNSSIIRFSGIYFV